MSLAEYLPKPPVVFSKLAGILGNLRAVQFVVAKVSALLGGNKASTALLVSEFTSETSGFTGPTEDKDASVPIASSTDAVAEPATESPAVARSIVHAYAAVLKPPGSDAAVEPGTIAEPAAAIAKPETSDKFARENLIRRRWAETGSKLWNPDVHGARNAALNIQGGIALLPPKPGGTLPRYDTLEFRTLRSRIDGQEVIRIVCEGVAVDPPQRRSRDGVRRAQ
jgi:hypothetical protein